MNRKSIIKRVVAIFTAFCVICALAACTEMPEQPETQAAEQTQQTEEANSGIANPWSSCNTIDQAAQGAGLDTFEVIDDGTETGSGPINWYGFQYMDGIAEADGAIGAAEITIRKGNTPDGSDISGDYNNYTYTWTIDVNGTTVNCSGNEDGQAMLATWTSGGYSFSIVIRGQGDMYDTYGVPDETISTLVTACI